MTIEHHIEELRLELKNAWDAAERRQIETELQLAEADLAVMLAEQEGAVEAEPPF
jgi:predicted lipid carrier protein YhbT